MGSSNTGLNDDSASVSGGSNTNTDSDSATQTDEGSPCLFEENEQVLAFHNQKVYKAKVIKAQHQSRGWQYFVHYLGWKKNWDEWLGVERLMKYNDENAQKFLSQKQDLEKNAKAIHASKIKLKSSSVGRGKKRKNDSLSKEKGAVSLEKFVNLQLPPMLKKQLVDDCEFVTHLGKLVKLPRSPNVDIIMKKYLEYRLKKDGLISEAIKEITKGLCCYFNKALPVMLLYKSEREQFADTIKDGISPSAVYGAEHLLRLFGFSKRIRVLFSFLLIIYWKRWRRAPTEKMIRLESEGGILYIIYHVITKTEIWNSICLSCTLKPLDKFHIENPIVDILGYAM